MQHIQKGLCRQLENSSTYGLTSTSIECVMGLNLPFFSMLFFLLVERMERSIYHV